MIGFNYSVKDLKKLSLKQRFLLCLFREKNEIKFSEKAVRLIRERQREIHGAGDFDENAMAQIKILTANMENAYDTLFVLERLYKSEFDDYEEWKPLMDKIADSISDQQLVTYGWKGEGK